MRIALGIFAGGFVDIGLTMLLGLPITIFMLISTNYNAVSPDAGMAYYHTHPAMYAASILTGCIGSVAGGYVAAWIARHALVWCGLFSAWLCVLSGLITLANPAVSPLEHLIGFVGGPAFAALGGYLRMKQLHAAAAAA